MDVAHSDIKLPHLNQSEQALIRAEHQMHEIRLAAIAQGRAISQASIGLAAEREPQTGRTSKVIVYRSPSPRTSRASRQNAYWGECATKMDGEMSHKLLLDHRAKVHAINARATEHPPPTGPMERVNSNAQRRLLGAGAIDYENELMLERLQRARGRLPNTRQLALIEAERQKIAKRISRVPALPRGAVPGGQLMPAGHRRVAAGATHSGAAGSSAADAAATASGVEEELHRSERLHEGDATGRSSVYPQHAGSVGRGYFTGGDANRTRMLEAGWNGDTSAVYEWWRPLPGVGRQDKVPMVVAPPAKEDIKATKSSTSGRSVRSLPPPKIPKPPAWAPRHTSAPFEVAVSRVPPRGYKPPQQAATQPAPDEQKKEKKSSPEETHEKAAEETPTDKPTDATAEERVGETEEKTDASPSVADAPATDGETKEDE